MQETHTVDLFVCLICFKISATRSRNKGKIGEMDEILRQVKT